MMSPFAAIDLLVRLYIWVVIIDIVLSWLINFDVINSSSPFVRTVHTFTFKMTNPAYKKIRSVVPAIGGLDLSPIFLIIGVQVAWWLIASLLFT